MTRQTIESIKGSFRPDILENIFGEKKKTLISLYNSDIVPEVKFSALVYGELQQCQTTFLSSCS